MKVDYVYINVVHQWRLVIEGTENGKKVVIYRAIPPTNGNRVDVITPKDLEKGYLYDVDFVIVIEIINGIPYPYTFKKDK